MKLKYYFGAAVIAASLLVSAVILGWVEDTASTLAIVSIPLLLVGVAAAWFLDTLDRRLAELSQTARLMMPAAALPSPGRPRRGDAVHVIAHSLDGVQQRMNELRTGFEQQRAIAEHAPDAMWVLDVEAGCIADVNQSFVDLSGFPREELIGMSPSVFESQAPSDGKLDSDFARSLIDKALTGERVVAICTLITRSGKSLNCEVRAIKLPSLPGRTLIGGSIIDVGDRLSAERAVADRLGFEALISRLSTEMINFDSSRIDDGIQHALQEVGGLMQADRCSVYLYDSSDRVLTCSHEWAAVGVPSLRASGAASPAQSAWSQAILQRGEIVNVARVADLPDEAGNERAAWTRNGVQSVVVVPLRPRPSVPGVVGFEWISTERVWPAERVFLLTVFGELISNLLSRQAVERTLDHQREALELSISELTRSNSELQRFAYAASHDLQEPLRAISGFSDLLARRYKGKLDATADEYLDFVRDAAKRMRGMIVNLLDYSRIDASPRPFERCDLNEVLRLALANLHASIEELEANIECDRLPAVMGDPSQLTQLLQNLLSNAIKFHADTPPQVRVEARRTENEWLLSVRDNGIGIRAEDSERVFEVFKRLHSADKYPGSGIGLSVCKRIIERHRGHIWAQPNDGGGAVFFFTLPVLVDEA